MNRLRIMNNLRLHNSVRTVYPILEINNSRFLDVGNTKIRFSQTFNKSRQFEISGYPNDKITSNTAISAENVSTKFVSQNDNKMTEFCAFTVGRKHEFLRKKNCILTVTAGHGACYYTNIRQFSDSSAIPTIPQYVQMEGFWKTLSESAAVEFSQNAIIWLHTSTGLPWWATIILATWTIRTFVTLPLALYQSNILAKCYNHKDEMDIIVRDLKMETNYAVDRFKWTESYARAIYNRSLKKQRQKLIERDNCHPAKSFILILVQIPMWITVSASLRNLCYVLPYPTERAWTNYLELTTGGFGWATNLTLPDSFYIIPVTLGLLNLTIIELQYMLKVTEPSVAQKYVAHLFRFIALAMIPLSSYVPTAMSLYWASSSAYGIVQNVCLMSPNFRRLARIPPTETELSEPYRHLYENFRRRIGLKENPLPDKGK